MKRRTTPAWIPGAVGDPQTPSRLGVLTASIAHEVNQPLSGIVTNATTCLRLLSTEPPDLDRVRETARRTLRDANRVSGIVERLRALFEGTPIVLEPVDVNEAVNEALELASREIAANHVSVSCKLADGLPRLMADRIALQQVIHNLVKNAVEAMAGQVRARALTITTRRCRGNWVLLQVTDVGVGFARKDEERLFAPFFTTKVHGMGIGLSMSRTIIAHHGGRLHGRPNGSRPGATFWISLPIPSTKPTHESRCARLPARVEDAVVCN